MGRSPTEWIDLSSECGMVHIHTHKEEVIRVLANHPEAELVEIDVDQDCKITRGLWRIPGDCFQIILTGDSELRFQLP